MATISERVATALMSIDRALRILKSWPEPSQADIEALTEIRSGMQLVLTLPEQSQVSAYNNYVDRLHEISDRLMQKETMN